MGPFNVPQIIRVDSVPDASGSGPAVRAQTGPFGEFVQHGPKSMAGQYGIISSS